MDYLSAIKQDEYFEWDSEAPYFKEGDGEEEVDERFSLGEIGMPHLSGCFLLLTLLKHGYPPTLLAEPCLLTTGNLK